MYNIVYTWTKFVDAVLWFSSLLWTQIALEKELGTCIPTVLQVNIKMILLNKDMVELQQPCPAHTSNVY